LNLRKPFGAFNTNSPMHWFYSNQLRGEWSAYNEILKKQKNDSIQEQLGAWPYMVSKSMTDAWTNDTIVSWPSAEYCG
jgi:hypothetical protein